ncbi:MAG: hypothetical protein ABWX88_08605 [Pseudoxanthomonas sp.]
MFPLVRLSLIAALVAGPAFSQESKAPAYTPEESASMAQMKALEAEVRTDKRALIQEQVPLTPEEAAKFWPIYDAHQAALTRFNQRRLDNIIEYARYYNADTLDDAAATRLAREALAVEKDEAAEMEKTFDKLSKAIPALKAVRYLQVESKLRAIVRFGQAAQVPLVE